MIGETISHYTIIEKVGEGGMGVVYKARDVNLDRIVAIKLLPVHLSSDEEATRRFIHEARAASALDHPNIGTIYEIDTTDDGLTFIAMAYYEGETLRERIDRGELTAEEIMEICSSIAAGLDKAHRSGIVHRDIKPSNILFSGDGEVKIVDFGLAKLEGRSRLTREGTTLGTAAYMSPEQAQGLDTDGRSDIFSLGVILYEMLAGRLPFRGEHEAALLYGIVHEEPETLPENVIEDWDKANAIITRALAKDPAARYESAGDMRNDIEGVADTGAPTGRKGKVSPGRRVPVPVYFLLLTAVLAFFVVRHFTAEKEGGEDTAWITAAPLPNWILISDFEGPLDDPRVADVVRGRVESSLSESSIVTPLSRKNMMDGLKKAMLPDTARISGEVARELAYRAGAESYVEGKVDKVFGGYAVQVNVYGTENGNILFSIHETSDDDAGMFRALARIGDSLLVNLGENVEELASRKIMPDVKSASMEVFKLYEEASELHGRLQYSLVMEKLDQALAVDPDFAAAWLQKGIIYSNWHQIENAINAFNEAERRKERLTESQQLSLKIMRNIINNEYEAALELVRERIRKFNTGYNGLSVIFHELGRVEEAYEASSMNAQRAPFGPNTLVLGNLAELATLLGRYEEADEFIERIENDDGRAFARILWMLAQSGWKGSDSIYTEYFLKDFGPFFELEISRGAIRKAETVLDDYPEYPYFWSLAFSKWHLLEISGVKMDLTAVTECRDDEMPCLLFLGFREAAVGNPSKADGFLAAIKDRPTYEQNFYATDVVLLKAWIEASRGNYDEAVAMLVPHVDEGRMPHLAGTLTIRWLIAESLESSGRLEEAVKAFEHVISPLGLSKRDDLQARPTYVAQAHRRLALLYSRLGDADKAREHLAAFEEMFTDPDPALMPLLETARSAVMEN